MLHFVLAPLLLLASVSLAGGQAQTSTLVGQSYAPEWQPGLDLAYLRPKEASRDFQRPACELPAGSGKFTGICTEEITDAPKLISFCSDLVRYRACVPAHQVMWPEWNATAKDLLLKAMFKDMVEARVARERNVTPDMYVPIHYLSNPNCVNSLKNALCWYNFPKCDDTNRSLSLCKSTCNEYYTNCKYKSLEGCDASSIDQKGLFQAGVEPGPDQQLAEAETAVCQRTPTDAEIGITVEEAETPWYKSWYGIIGMSLAGLIVIILLGYILIPPVLMSYLKVQSVRLSWFPYRFWMGIPLLRGRKVLCCMVFVFFALFAAGVYQTISKGFTRWDAWKDDRAEGEYQFQPPQFIWGTQATKPLTNQQLRQLKNSCSCTGGANRGLPSIFAVAVAVCWQWLWFRGL